MRLLLVTVAGTTLGMGHLKRCLTIAAAATEFDVAFIVCGDPGAATLVRSAGYSAIELPLAALSALGEFPRADVVLADVIYGSFFDAHDPVEVFGGLRAMATLLLGIDSLGEHSLARRSPLAPLDILVVPYAVGSIELSYVAKVGKRQLSGLDYALLPSQYAGLPPRMVRQNADRILITTGGSDPHGWTPRIIDALRHLGQCLQIRVIAGPLFSPTLKIAVDDAAARSSHSVEIVRAPESLVEHMAWCDIAIASSGLTKYELAAASAPTVLFSIDELHDAANQMFAGMGSVLDLGVCPSGSHIADEASRLLKDHVLRARLAEAGQRMVDGLGAARLVAEVKRELLC